MQNARLCQLPLPIAINSVPFLPLPRAPGGVTKNICSCMPLLCQQVMQQVWLDLVQKFRIA